MLYQINQIFENTYPPEAAIWCNQQGNCYIEQIDNVDGRRRFQIKEIPAPTPEQLEAQALQQAKAERAQAVANIKVQVDGMVFDGDEVAQGRMARTITAAQAEGVDVNTTKRIWVLADNTVAEPTVAQLAKALRLAGDEQTRLWTIPYEQTQEQSTETIGLRKVGL